MNNKKNLRFYFFLAVALIFVFSCAAEIALAQSATTDNSYGLGEAAGKAGLNTSLTAAGFLGTIAGGALAIAGSLFLFLIIYGGIIIMTAAGNTDNVKKGKNIITWAIIGAIILGAAYAITSFIFQVISSGK